LQSIPVVDGNFWHAAQVISITDNIPKRAINGNNKTVTKKNAFHFIAKGIRLSANSKINFSF
jgi:hypothetical protein